jgi:regulator of protease activity HflC (stomatin/prohibitin superfamily)
MKISIIFFTALILCSCAVIRPGEVGMKSKFGKLGKPKENGVIAFNPFVSRVIKLPIQTVNREVMINLPSKEGLTIKSEISILYRLNPKMAKSIVTEIGLSYDKIVIAVFRSASADVTSKFFAKDMHSGERDKIEKEIAKKMNDILNEKGFEIEAVLMKSITLPDGLAKAIEAKLEAEQQAQRMEFVLQAEKKEAERKSIEAIGIRDAQLILSDGLTDKILQLRQIEMMGNLTNSNNSKIIFTDGKTPVFVSPEK